MVRKLEMQTVGGFLVISFLSCFLGKWELAGLEVVSELFPVTAREEVLGSLASMAAFVAYCRPVMRLYTYCSRRDASPILLSLVVVVLLSNILWTIYGISTLNPWIYVPQGSGVLVSSMQILVRLIFPGNNGKDKREDGLKKQASKDLEASAAGVHHDDTILRLSSRQTIHEDYLLWQKEYHRWRSVASASSTTTSNGDAVAEDVGMAEDGQLLPNQPSPTPEQAMRQRCATSS